MGFFGKSKEQQQNEAIKKDIDFFLELFSAAEAMSKTVFGEKSKVSTNGYLAFLFAAAQNTGRRLGMDERSLNLAIRNVDEDAGIRMILNHMNDIDGSRHLVELCDAAINQVKSGADPVNTIRALQKRLPQE